MRRGRSDSGSKAGGVMCGAGGISGHRDPAACWEFCAKNRRTQTCLTCTDNDDNNSHCFTSQTFPPNIFSSNNFHLFSKTNPKKLHLYNIC